MKQAEQIAEYVAGVIEIVGVAILAVGAVVVLIQFLLEMAGVSGSKQEAYRRLRRNFGKAILLGLEFLVAGDIISTITIQPTYQSVGVLGLVVLIRTFLSFSLEVELNGRWPWQSKKSKG